MDTRRAAESVFVLGEIFVHSVGDEESLLVTPRGKRFYVHRPAQELADWADGVTGSRDPMNRMPDGFQAVVTALREDGCLAETRGQVSRLWQRAQHPALNLGRLRRTTVLITGDAGPVNALHAVLTEGEYANVQVVDILELPDTLPAPDVIVVAAFSAPDAGRLLEVDELCAATGTPWMPLRWQDGRAFVGPGVIPGSTVSFRDVYLRRKASAPDPRVFDASWTNRPDDRVRTTAAEASWVYATVAVQIERWLAGAYRADVAGSEVELDPVEIVVDHHFVLPLPDRPFPPPETEADRWKLTDAQTGIINRVRHISGVHGLPPSLNIAVVDLADMRKVLEWPNDRQAFGSSWDSTDAAHKAATGEAVERYSGNWMSPDRDRATATYRQLVRRGDHALDPTRVVLYSPRQYESRGFPFVPFTRDSEATWIRAWSLSEQRELWVPACLVYVMWHETQGAGEPRYSYPNLAGIAAGETLDYARLSALEEVVERDATMIWWANAQPLPALKIPRELAELFAPVGDRYDVRIIPLDNEFDVPVMAGAVRDRSTGALGIGFAVRHTPVDAARKALAEAFALQLTCRSLDDPKGMAALVSKGLQNFGNLKPWRADRRYLDDYRADFHDVVDLMCQQQVYLDRRAGERVAPRIWDTPERDRADLPSLPDRSLATMLARVENRGYEVISVDVSTSDVATAGYHAVRVLVPGLISNFPAAFPQWGLDRARLAAVELGWRSDPPAEDELDVFPLPHA